MKKRVLSAVLAFLTVLSVVMALGVNAGEVSPYRDVKTGRWSYKAIKYVTDNGLMNGISADRFAPKDTMTRAMVVTVLYRMQNSPKVIYTPIFTDVKKNSWYSDAVIWAAQNDIVNGKGNGKFAPMDNITREQLAAIMMRYAPSEYIITEERANIKGYDDYKLVSKYARTALSWANAIELVTGKTKTTLDPQSGATREEFATILKRFREYDSFSYTLAYCTPKPIGTYTEKPYEFVTDADFYVAVDGNDEAEGSLNAPFKTFERAVEAVRERKAENPDGGITVAFKAGTYKAPVGLSFTSADSGSETCPITYCKYGDGDVIFSGGATIDLEDFTELNDADKEMFLDKYEDKIKKVDLTECGISSGEISTSTSVFSGQKRLDLARWPNKLENGNDDFTKLYTSVSEDQTYINLMLPLVKKLNGYHKIEDMYMFGYYRYDWSASDGKVKKFEPDTGRIYPDVNHYGIFNNPEGDPSNPCPYFYFYNIPDELDCADEYYIDKDTNTLYAMDPSDDFVLCLTGDMISMKDVDHISFVGLTFSYSTGSCITANDTDYMTFDRCNFNNLREKGIYITGDNNLITSCEFRDVGARNVEMITGDRETLTQGNSVIENCLFDRFGSVTKTGQPAIYAWGCGIRIANNEISNSSNIGIFYSEYIWASNYITIEYNYIHDVVTQSSDSGAIYGGRNLAGHGTVIRYNLLCNVGRHDEGHNALGIYLDDQMSGQEIYGNIFYNMANHGVFVNGGRENKIHDNIMISPTDYVKEEILIGQNFYNHAEAITENFTLPLTDTEHIMILELVPFRNELWTSKFPTLAKITYDVNNMAPYVDDRYCVVYPSFNEVYDNHFITTQNRIDKGRLEVFEEYAEKYATRLEKSKVYTVEENPFFVNPSIGDYRIDPDKSNIDIPYEKIGRY